MKFSVITWDASFREKFHTVTCFCNQDFDNENLEFTWVDYYDNDNLNLEEEINKYPYARLINLNNEKNRPWHLSECLNKGIENAKGDFLIIPDGDILVESDFLKTAQVELERNSKLVLYFRRWDELENDHGEDSYNIEYLKSKTKLYNSTNYAGCIAISKENLLEVGGYEEHSVFQKAGANSKELYLRLRNSGLDIKWHSKKVYHPWHPFSGNSDKNLSLVKILAKSHHWINPYCGIEQSWVLHKTDLDVENFKSDITKVDKYLEQLPNLKVKNYDNNNLFSWVRKMINNVFL